MVQYSVTDFDETKFKENIASLVGTVPDQVSVVSINHNSDSIKKKIKVETKIFTLGVTRGPYGIHGFKVNDPEVWSSEMKEVGLLINRYV